MKKNYYTLETKRNTLQKLLFLFEVKRPRLYYALRELLVWIGLFLFIASFIVTVWFFMVTFS